MNKRDLIWLKLCRYWDSLWDSILVVAVFWLIAALLLCAPRCTYMPQPPAAIQTGR